MRLLTRTGAVESDEAARLLVARQDPLLVAEAAKAMSGDNWERDLRAALYDGVDALEPSPLHLAAVAHLLGGERGDTALVTLNFDTLLEQAIESESRVRARSTVDLETDADGFDVHHLHGVVTPGDAEKVVLTLTDFTRLVDESETWQLEYIRSAINRGALVIAGTSYRDPDLRQWLHAALRESPGEHAAAVLLAREGFGLSKSQFDQVKSALESQWRAVGMRPVLLHDFSDAAQIIRELRHLHDSEYPAPQDRALTIWRSHADRFDELQTSYAAQLHDDALAMGDALDYSEMNVTLWLADGRGKLARWASQDRVQRSVDGLRLIESGHDSPLIAGRTLASDSLLFEDIDGGGTHRWRSVLSSPIPVPHPRWPPFTSAVLSIGLPQPVETYVPAVRRWSASLTEIVDAWSTRLSVTAFGEHDE